MVRFRISVSFLGAALIRARSLLEGGTFSDMSVNGSVIRGRRFFEARRLLEEIGYLNESMNTLFLF